MKKLLLVLTISLTFALAGCLPSTLDAEDGLTEQEIEDIVEAYLEANKEELEQEVTTTYDLQSFEQAIVDMIEVARTGVLGVFATSENSGGSGSGVVYKVENSTDYYLVTNEHVIVHTDADTGEDVVATNISIVYEKNGLLFEITNEYVEILGYDKTTDLAVLKFSSNQSFSVIPFGNSNEIELGQFVYAIGNPLGFEYYGTVTSGIISGKARYVNDGEFDATLLQHDAAISPGNSGGALLNSNGELIGINNMKLVEDSVSNIGFAIPANTVKRIVTDLEDDGEITRPYLGISTAAQINACGLDYGVCINVQEGGAADNAGLEDGDVIIGYKLSTEADYKEINNFNDLKEAILNSSVGDTVIIKYIREGVILESTPTELGVHPDDQ